ncbi:MAG: FAD-dependent oxidoreductase [Hyphomicrobium sp.]
MGDNIAADICVIGADPGGLAVAMAAAAFGRSVVLVEWQLGGETLGHGALAQRALAAVGNRAHAMRTADVLGIAGRDAEFDMRAVNKHVGSVIAGVRPNFAAERFVGLGIRVVHGAGRFINKKTVVAGEQRIRARRFVIATGAVPVMPSIPGLNSVPYLTTETIFTNQERLHNLIIIGGDRAALELAQTYSRLGSRVIVLEAGKALGEEDPELTKFLLEQLADEGIAVHENTKVDSVEGGLGACASTSPWEIRSTWSRAATCWSPREEGRRRPTSGWRRLAFATTSAHQGQWRPQDIEPARLRARRGGGGAGCAGGRLPGRSRRATCAAAHARAAR